MIDNVNGIQLHTNITIPGKHARNILIDVYAPAKSDYSPVVIFSHGFKGFKDWGPFNHIANLIAAAGFVFVKFNFSYNGTTEDEPTEFSDLDAFGNNNFTKELEDLECVLDWVHQESDRLRADISAIALVGHSRGGGITILKAAEDDRVKTLVTWAAVADFGRFLTKQDISKWKDSGVHFVENARTGQSMPLYLQLYDDFVQNQHRLHIKSAISRLQIPMLIVHGTADETVPVQQAEELHMECSGNSTLVPIEGADHTFGSSHPFMESKLPAHFQRVINETLHFLKKSFS